MSLLTRDEICEYDSFVYGEIREVVFVQYNVVDRWPIRTAQVRFSSGRVESVCASQLTGTGRFVEEKPRLIFGQK